MESLNLNASPSNSYDSSPTVQIGNTQSTTKSNEDDKMEDEPRIDIKDEDIEGDFSFRKLWAFTGPGFLMSIAYLDPASISSDMQSGIIAKYKLLWVLMSATILGLLMQRLSARLGVVTGYHLAEMCFRQYRMVPRLILWIMIEISIIATDIQEVIGTAIAIYILTGKFISIPVGVLLTIVDTFTFLFLDKYGLRKLEYFFGLLIAIMSISFGYEYVVTGPSTSEVLKGLVIPWCRNCRSQARNKVVEIIGATIEPHNLYLHSALVKSRKINRDKPQAVRNANFYFFIEAAIVLFVSFVLNVFVVAVFGHGLYEKTNNDVRNSCRIIDDEINENFPPNDNPVEVGLYSAGIFLSCSIGAAAMYIWAVGILAAGQSSTMTGTYAGQFVMDGFLNLQWARWRRVLFTRVFAITPTLIVALHNDLSELTSMNDFLNAVLSIQLPFALIPVIALTSNSRLMGEFTSGWGNRVLVICFSFIVIGINLFYISESVYSSDVNWLIFVIAGIFAILYVFFCVYLFIHMATSMGCQFLQSSQIVQKLVTVPLQSDEIYDNPVSFHRN